MKQKVNGLLREKCQNSERAESLSEGISTFRIIYIEYLQPNAYRLHPSF